MKSKTVTTTINLPIAAVSSYLNNSINITNLLLLTNNNQFRRMYYYQQNLYLALQYGSVGQVNVHIEDCGFSISYTWKNGQQFGVERYNISSFDAEVTQLTVTASGSVNSMMSSENLKMMANYISQGDTTSSRFIPEISDYQLTTIRKQLIKELAITITCIVALVSFVSWLLGADSIFVMGVISIGIIIFIISKERGDKRWCQSSMPDVELRLKKSILRYLPWLFFGLVIISQLVLLWV